MIISTEISFLFVNKNSVYFSSDKESGCLNSGHSVDIRPRTATPPRQHQSDYHNRKISAPTRFNSKGSTPTNNSTPTHNNAEENNSHYDNVKINIDNHPYEIKFIEEATRNEPDYIWNFIN